MIIGYARTSTLEQQAGLEAQERDLRAAGAEEIHSEQVSSIGKRPGLEQAIGFSRRGRYLSRDQARPARQVSDPYGGDRSQAR